MWTTFREVASAVCGIDRHSERLFLPPFSEQGRLRTAGDRPLYDRGCTSRSARASTTVRFPRSPRTRRTGPGHADARPKEAPVRGRRSRSRATPATAPGPPDQATPSRRPIRTPTCSPRAGAPSACGGRPRLPRRPRRRRTRPRRSSLPSPDGCTRSPPGRGAGARVRGRPNQFQARHLGARRCTVVGGHQPGRPSPSRAPAGAVSGAGSRFYGARTRLSPDCHWSPAGVGGPPDSHTPGAMPLDDRR